MAKKHTYTLPAKNRLKRKKLFEEVFASGKVLRTQGLSLVFKIATLEKNVITQAGFSVPKRRFKKATDRNYLKRIMREAWRQQRPEAEDLIKIKNLQLALVFVFTGQQRIHFDGINQKISLLLQQVLNELNQS